MSENEHVQFHDNLMREFPGSLGKYTRESEHSERRPARQGRPQRDLLPLPCPPLEPKGFSEVMQLDPAQRLLDSYIKSFIRNA